MAQPEDHAAEPEPDRVASARWTDFLGWGDHGRPDEDDLAEAYHEASKNLPSVLPPAAHATPPADDRRASATVRRPVQRHLARPTVALPRPDYPTVGLGDVLQARRSRRTFGPEPVPLAALATLLHAAYGVTAAVGSDPEPQRLRTVPSGGALYPLELYPLVRNVAGLAPGLYHYDPPAHRLEVVRAGDLTAALERVVVPLPETRELAATCGVVLFVVGVFWRTRFKYGLRGYRWVLIEAGHVGQSALLTAEGLGLHAVPLGGVWDRRVDELLGVDGVNESVVYTLVAGSPVS